MKLISRNRLEELGGLYITNAVEASNQYLYGTKKCSEAEAIAWIHSLAKEHTVYADFYVSRIDAKSLQILKERLSEKEMEVFQELLQKSREYKEEFILFEPEEQELELLMILSYRELLFSTFYFVDPAMTIWSSFDGEFVIFTENKELLNEITR